VNYFKNVNTANFFKASTTEIKCAISKRHSLLMYSVHTQCVYPENE